MYIYSILFVTIKSVMTFLYVNKYLSIYLQIRTVQNPLLCHFGGCRIRVYM